MNSDRTQKLMIVLLAGLAIGMSSFAHTSPTRGSADFASKEDDDSSEIVSSATTHDQINDFIHKIKTAKADVNNGEINGVLWQSDEGEKISGSNTSLDEEGKISFTLSWDDADGNHAETQVDADNLKQLQKMLPKRMERIRKHGQEVAEKAKSAQEKKEALKEDLENCNKKMKNGRAVAIDDNNVKEKLACLSAHLNKKSGDDKQAYMDEVVKKYVDLNLNKVKTILSSSNDISSAFTARSNLLQLQTLLQKNNLASDPSIAGQLNFANNIVNNMLAPLSLNQAQSQVFAKYAAAMANPQTRAQAQRAYANELNMMAYNSLSSTVGMQSSLTSAMMQNPSDDQGWNQLARVALSRSQQFVQQQVATNQSLNQSFGNIISKYDPRNVMANGLSNSALTSFDPNNLNAIYGNPLTNNNSPSLGNSLAWSNFDTTGLSGMWNPNPPTGSNMANPSLPTPSTVPTALRQNATTASAKQLQPKILTR